MVYGLEPSTPSSPSSRRNAQPSDLALHQASLQIERLERPLEGVVDAPWVDPASPEPVPKAWPRHAAFCCPFDTVGVGAIHGPGVATTQKHRVILVTPPRVRNVGV